MNIKEQIKAWAGNKSRFLIKDNFAIGITSSLNNILEIIDYYELQLMFDLEEQVWIGSSSRFKLSSCDRNLARDYFGKVEIEVNSLGWECCGVPAEHFYYIGKQDCLDFYPAKEYAELSDRDELKMSEFLSDCEEVKRLSFGDNQYLFSKLNKQNLMKKYDEFE